jgi:hypothetical protein
MKAIGKTTGKTTENRRFRDFEALLTRHGMSGKLSRQWGAVDLSNHPAVDF